MDFIYVFDLIGTFAFSVYGSYIGFKKGFDIFGIGVCAFLCALGGGTIREILLNNTPVYFFNYTYLYIVVLGIIFCAFIYDHFHKINKYMLILDAVGLAAFAFIGAAKAMDANLGIFGSVFFAVLTALGGGILKDMVANETPGSFTGEVYATPAILLGIFYFIFYKYMSNPFLGFTLIFLIFSFRVLAIQYKIKIKNKKDIKKFSKTPAKSLKIALSFVKDTF